MFQVTYLNTLLGRRCLLIDKIEEVKADEVVQKFGDNADANHRLPEVRKEPMPAKYTETN